MTSGLLRDLADSMAAAKASWVFRVQRFGSIGIAESLLPV